MKPSILLSIFILSHLTLMSQIEKTEFGTISPREMSMEKYLGDPEAGAVILFDRGVSEFIDFGDGYKIRFTRHKRIKVFNRSGYDAAEISIPLYENQLGEREELSEVVAVTYNQDQSQLSESRLRMSNVFEERISERWINQKFSFPDVQEGSILELKYVIETPFFFNLPDWTFQDEFPTVYSEYEVHMIPFYEYVYIAQGISRFDVQLSRMEKEERTWGEVPNVYAHAGQRGVNFNDMVFTYGLKNVPAFKDVGFISSKSDYIVKMDFQLAKFNNPYGMHEDIISTWPDLNRELLLHDNFGKYVQRCARFAKKELEKCNLVGDLNPLDKVKAIVNYVKENFIFNNLNSKYARQTPKDFINTSSGNSAEINLFLLAMLEESGFHVKPIILSTRDHGRIPSDYPFDHFTNYVVAAVELDSVLLLDATDPLLPYDVLPIRCRNDRGIEVTKDDKNLMWHSLSNESISGLKNMINLHLSDDENSLIFEVRSESDRYQAHGLRHRLSNDSESIKQNYISSGDIEKVSTLNYDDPEKSYIIDLSGSREVERLNDLVVISPFLLLPLEENPLQEDSRNLPLDFVYPWNDQFISKIAIPEGYEVASLPDSYKMENSLAKINIEYFQTDGMVTVEGEYGFLKSVYPASDYIPLKLYLNEIVNRFNEEIVLRKVN